MVGELLCTGVHANTGRHTRKKTREMCLCWGYKQHSSSRKSGAWLIQTSLLALSRSKIRIGCRQSFCVEEFIIIVGFQQLDKRHCSPLFCSSFFGQFFFFSELPHLCEEQTIHLLQQSPRFSADHVHLSHLLRLAAVYLPLKPSAISFFARFNHVPCLVICAGTVWCSLLVIQCNSWRRGQLEWYPQCASSCSHPFFVASEDRS